MQERILLDVKEIQTRAIENTDIMNNHIENMSKVLDKLTEQNTAFTRSFKSQRKQAKRNAMYEAVKLLRTNLKDS